MGEIKTHPPVVRLLVAFSRYPEALAWARHRAEQIWGPVADHSPVFDFDETDYYEASMGTDLKKQLFRFEQLMDPVELAEAKRRTNAWEEEYRTSAAFAEARPLNLDPGYLTEAKLVLATTKDRDHRLYLGEGIFAEVTLHYHAGQWRSRPWTYPDYGNGKYFDFLSTARQYLRRHKRYRDDQ